MTNTIRAVIDRVAGEFERAGLHFGHGTDNARDEAAWLVSHHCGIEPHDLEDHLDEAAGADAVNRIGETARARVRTRRPLAYLLHEAWFAGEKFFVDERVIVPRSLTAEFILERFAPWIDPGQVGSILDLCTGSGCMAIACARAFPAARIDAVDLSPAALEVARINVEQHGLRERVHLIRSDLFAALDDRRYDVVVSNPPYVDAADLAALPEEFRHEPALALAAGDDGLAIVQRILAGARAHLTDHGILVVEVGNSRGALERARPELPFVWLTTLSGDESVFLLTAGQL
jgi:ribosomal protein L3 glutamine methyltransferase